MPQVQVSYEITFNGEHCGDCTCLFRSMDRCVLFGNLEYDEVGYVRDDSCIRLVGMEEANEGSDVSRQRT